MKRTKPALVFKTGKVNKTAIGAAREIIRREIAGEICWIAALK